MDPVKKAIIEEANRRYEARNKGVQLIDRLVPEFKGTVVIRGMRGLGDNINQRAFINELEFPVFLDTPWPELYSDLRHVSFVNCETPLRTQQKNLKRQPPNLFVPIPTKDYSELKVQYGSRDLSQGSILKKLSWIFGGIKPTDFGLPPFNPPHWLFKPGFMPPIAIIRPVTVRKEWAAVSRNPDPIYIYKTAVLLINAGFTVISICDLEEGKEWLVGEEPPAHAKFHHGELNVEELLGLCRCADVLVGGHGWLTHAALAYRKQMLVVMGGFGGDNSPEKVADPNFLDPSNLTFVVPDNFCLCQVMTHNCDKKISNFDEKVLKWIGTLKN